jgi:hypothetical protein
MKVEREAVIAMYNVLEQEQEQVQGRSAHKTQRAALTKIARRRFKGRTLTPRRASPRAWLVRRRRPSMSAYSCAYQLDELLNVRPRQRLQLIQQRG